MNNLPLRGMIKSYDLPAIEKARQIIDKNPSDHWIISMLADKAGINECKLKKGFKILYRTTPYKYLLKLRLEKAKTLLEETDHTIQEISCRVGFETYKGFSLAFKNEFGILPTKYRRQAVSLYNETLSNLMAS